MKDFSRFKILTLFLAIGLLGAFQAHGQMKIGNNPTEIQPFSILELESGNQGLRLTQVADTADVNATITAAGATNVNDLNQQVVKDAEGLLVFQTQDSSVYMRTHGAWQKVLSNAELGDDFWQLGGTTVADSSEGFLGTANAQPLTLGMNNQGYIIIHSDGNMEVLADSSVFNNFASFGNAVTIADSLNVKSGAFRVTDSIYLNSALSINDSLVINTIGTAMGTEKDVLVIGADGTVRKMDMDSLAAKGVGISSINGLTKSSIHIKFGEDASKGGPWIDSTSTDSTLVLNIPDADVGVTGLVTDSTQSFGGAKTFVDSIAVGTTATPNATLDVQGNVNLKTVVATANYDMGTTGNDALRTLIVDVSGKTAQTSVTLPSVASMNGRTYTIKKIGDAGNNQIDAPVEIDTAGGDTFGNGTATSTTIYNNWSSLTIQALNGKWYIVGH